MARDVRLNKEVFDKRTYQKTIDTTFKELGVKTIQEQIDEQPTVQEFFDMYTELFYQINERGPDNSHEYLVKTSGEYISFEDKDELVEALQKEIANLRKELLQTQQDLADSLGDLAEASQPLPEIEEVEAPVEIPNPIADIIDTPEPTPTPVDGGAAPPPSPAAPTPTDPYPNKNTVAVEWYIGKINSVGESNAYRVRPVTYQMLKNNLEYVKQNGLLLNNKGNDYKNTRDTLENVNNDGSFPVNGSEVGENYKFNTWANLREIIRDNKKNNDAKENLFDVLNRTVDQLGSHYNRERNFKQSGGYI